MIPALILAAILASEPAPTLVSSIEENVARVMDDADADKQATSHPEEPGTLKDTQDLEGGFTNPDTKPTDAQTIHHFADTAFVYAMILGGDLYSTELARNHNPRFVETNKLLFTSDAAQAAKVMVMAGVTFADYKLYQSHPKSAVKLRRLVVLMGVGLIANNCWVAFGAPRR